MQLLLAVVDDLYTFAMELLFGPRRRSISGVQELQQSDAITDVIETDVVNTTQKIYSPTVAVSDVVVGVEKETEEDVEELPPPTFKRMDSIITERFQDGSLTEEGKDVAELSANTIMYVSSVDAPLYRNPTREFDTVLSTVLYGKMVMVLKQQGRWVSVVCGKLSGWMLREDLVDNAAHVLPAFVIGEHNEADDPNTVKVRRMIGDTFGGGALELPLQSGEYVLYRLLRKGLTIPWTDVRPRTPGKWHSILKGLPRIHVGVTPKTGTIMEYMVTEDRGHVAYVESVFPDETITLSEADFPEVGIYNERTVTRSEWREYKPVFIQVS